MRTTLHFFLGGRDLEMLEIASLVRNAPEVAVVTDDGLPWGASLSHYAARIEAAHAAGCTPVAVELRDDMPEAWGPRARLIDIDHHGARASGPSSLRQVYRLLAQPPHGWTRRLALVEANDVNHIAGLFAAGASVAEARAIRAEDRAAQGITRSEEVAGAAAARAARPAPGTSLHVVHLPHARMATAMDPLAFETYPDLPQALVTAPGEIAFFGNGAGVLALDAAFPGGWTGGALPANGFWGHDGKRAPLPAEAEARAILTSAGIF